jgi:hypothetical protein
LEKINLCSNNLNDRSAVPLGQLIKSNSIKLDVVSVANNNMTSIGIRQLVEDALTSPSITVLNVVGNPGLNDPTVVELINGTLVNHLNTNRQQKIITTEGKRQKRKKQQRKGSRMKKRGKLPETSFHVGIVGGGIGGLALALALHGKGIHCTVFERDESFDQRHQGYGLTLQQGGRAMKSINVADEIALQGAWSSRHFIFNQHGDVLAFWGPKYTEKNDDEGPFDKIKKMGRHNIHIGRQALRGILYNACLERLPVDSLRWGYKLDHITTNNSDCKSESTDSTSSACTLHFSSNKSASSPSSSSTKHGSNKSIPTFDCDLVVGCDGIRSSVRQQYINDKMIYLDLMVMLGIFDI